MSVTTIPAWSLRTMHNIILHAIIIQVHVVTLTLPPYRDRLERTPLHLAAMKSHAEIVALLIEADALLEAKDNRNVSAWVRMYYV